MSVLEYELGDLHLFSYIMSGKVLSLVPRLRSGLTTMKVSSMSLLIREISSS